MKGVRIFHSVNGWVVETPIPLSKSQLRAAIAFHKKVLKQRFPTWTKEKQQQVLGLLKGLDEHTIVHHLIPQYPWEQDRILV